MHSFITKTILLSIIATLVACSTSPKSEADHYRQMRDGTIYKAYIKFSRKAMKPVVEEYNQKLAKQKKDQNADFQVHALLALIWVSSLQSKFALAEADYAVGSSSEPKDKYTALVLQSIAMHEEGWPHLARQKSDEAHVIASAHNFKNRYNNYTSLIHVAGSILALKDGNITYVASEIKSLGTATNKSWLNQIGDATLEVHNGAKDKALQRLSRLKADSSLSDSERVAVDKLYKVLADGGKDVTGNFFKAVTSLALYVAIEDNPLSVAVVQKLPEKYRNKLADYLKK